MCGIIGYIGTKQALPILLEGLRRLEYRGYDSAGVALVAPDPLGGEASGSKIFTERAAGKVSELENKFIDNNLPGLIGIGHTRWATHGAPKEENAHPHGDCENNIAVVHNGIIENYQELKNELAARGHKFRSETDTEVIAHLLEDEPKELSLEKKLMNILPRLVGTYGLAVIDKNDSKKIVVARLGSPLVIGIRGSEFFIASDPSAFISQTREVLYLDDGEVAALSPQGIEIIEKGISKNKQSELLEWSAEKIEKQGYPHFMLKEINEQPKVIEDTIRGRLEEKDGLAHLGGLKEAEEKLRKIEKIIIVGCGSALYSGKIGEYIIEEYAGIPVECEYASEFRYRKPVLDDSTAVLAVSQSGETADTLAAIREAKRKGVLTLGMVNAVGSTIARETDAGIYNHAGPEIGVASTKAFISQVAAFALITLFLGRQRQMSAVTGVRIAEELKTLPEKISQIFSQKEQIESIAEKYAKFSNFLYLGRKYNAPIALEGALKLKEISYIHAEGYPAGEMKHGPIALLDKNFPVVAIAPKDSVYEKMKSAIEEAKARQAPVLALTTEGNNEMENLADDIIYIPKTLEMLTPILSIIPLQLFAYYIAVSKGYDPDRPRNLAKSVTVE
ncbi:glutamine--fructose-6-phosphate transaminase (isomerizing) [Patescibacteria group bacterium]|nr:MAG: glutamine--fructose-6-phosphate transaminase (isomerizing) [Patescibacteria group bacterium]